MTPCLDGCRYISYNHIVALVAKKTAISITIDGDLLRALDAMLREVQEKELRGRKKLSNRSALIERIVADYVSRRGSDR
jgi:metal-responsive CopG/Arc/MetJ family transcriptional regulator